MKATMHLPTTMLTLFLTMLQYASAQDDVCPGSPAWKFASCKMNVKFKNTSCSEVQSEINQRLESTSWVDPHNQGTYTKLENTSGNVIKAQRLTGDGKYTDLFNFSFTDGSDGGCDVTACSQSQCISVLDFSTNYCNLRNLYCSSADGCVPLQFEFDYVEVYTDCGQNVKDKCIAAKSVNL